MMHWYMFYMANTSLIYLLYVFYNYTKVIVGEYSSMNPPQSWKYPKWKTHSIYLVSQMPRLSNTAHCRGWILPSCSCDCGSMPLPASWARIICKSLSPGKDQNWSLEVHFLLNSYHFCAIMLSVKNLQPNHLKSRTLNGCMIYVCLHCCV